MNSDILYERAVAAIREVHNDMTASATARIASLGSLGDEIDILIDAIKSSDSERTSA